MNKGRGIVQILHGPLTAWLVLVCGLVVTASAWVLSTEQVEKRARERLDFRIKELTAKIEGRIMVYEQVLWGAAGLFDASESVTRQEWKAYVKKLSLEQRWPGIQGLGWAVKLAPEERLNFEKKVRAEGFPQFAIQPAEPRASYTSILFLEPFDWRNQRAFGYDMATNEVRRLAMTRAAQTGHASTSGKITLVQETKTGVQSGFLTYVPVYQKQLPTSHQEERERALLGWVYAAFRAGDLMDGILGRQDHLLEFEVYDGKPSSESLLYDSNEAREYGVSKSGYQQMETIHLQGRSWSIFFISRDPARNIETSLPALVAGMGIVIDLLLFYLITVLVSNQRRTQREVQQKTRELRDKNQELVRSNENLAQFAEIASHDLQEPLRTVVSFSELLELEYGESIDEEGREYLGFVASGARRMRELLRDTLAFSRVSQAERQIGPINCQLVIQTVLESHADLLSRHNVQVHVGELPTIQSSKLLSQVFGNLIANASIYHTGDSERHVWITAERSDTHWTFAVSDDGIGIEPRHRDRIFKLFERLHSNGEYPGSGLGLAVCHRVVTDLKGEIWVEENVPRGSRFLFKLPHLEVPN